MIYGVAFAVFAIIVVLAIRYAADRGED